MGGYMKRSVTINGKEFKLVYTISAMEKVDEAIGEEKGGIAAWLSGKPATVMKRIVEMIAILANAKAEKDRVEAAAGLLAAEPQGVLSASDVAKVITPGMAIRYREAVLSAISDGLAVELPEELERRRDYDLEEIEQKNA